MPLISIRLIPLPKTLLRLIAMINEMLVGAHVLHLAPAVLKLVSIRVLDATPPLLAASFIYENPGLRNLYIGVIRTLTLRLTRTLPAVACMVSTRLFVMGRNRVVRSYLAKISLNIVIVGTDVC